jgi:hypothetical protein
LNHFTVPDAMLHLLANSDPRHADLKLFDCLSGQQ